MRQQPIVDRLAGLGFRSVGGALEYAALRQVPGQLPAAYVVPQGEAAGDNRLATCIDQRVLVGWAVMLLLPPAARADGAVDELLERLSKATIDALLGWTHPQASGPTTYVGGDLAGVDAGALVWALRFRSPYHLRKV